MAAMRRELGEECSESLHQSAAFDKSGGLKRDGR